MPRNGPPSKKTAFFRVWLPVAPPFAIARGKGFHRPALGFADSLEAPLERSAIQLCSKRRISGIDTGGRDRGRRCNNLRFADKQNFKL